MSEILKIEMILVALLLLVIIIIILKNKKMSIKYSVVWLFSAFLILLFALFPTTIEKIANALGFEALSNMIFLLMFGILFFICLSLTIIVSSQRAKIDLLIQELSLLKNKETNNEISKK